MLRDRDEHGSAAGALAPGRGAVRPGGSGLDIQTEPANRTRFLVLGGADVVSCQPRSTRAHGARHCWSGVRNEPGTLYRVLGVLAAHGLNMSKLESRPSRTRAGSTSSGSTWTRTCVTPLPIARSLICAPRRTSRCASWAAIREPRSPRFVTVDGRPGCGHELEPAGRACTRHPRVPSALVVAKATADQEQQDQRARGRSRRRTARWRPSISTPQTAAPSRARARLPSVYVAIEEPMRDGCERSTASAMESAAGRRAGGRGVDHAGHRQRRAPFRRTQRPQILRSRARTRWRSRPVAGTIQDPAANRAYADERDPKIG